ncbi:MAG TPA: c-type cytochrome [Bacteroidales bacterium]|nr:c-type cytochrome [Bacteroidales bacterium]
MKSKIWSRILGYGFLSLLGVVACVVFYIVLFMPHIPVNRAIKAEPTPERIERGRYLANHVMVCVDCHSTRDWSRFSGPMAAGTEGKGGEIFDEKMGFPGHFRAPNITPFALKEWSDAEIYRAITSGVSRDGHPMFPIMPYPAYSTLGTEDILSVIAYLRTLTPLDNTPPRSTPTFPMNIVLHLMPLDAAPQTIPPAGDTVAYGEYLVKAAGCIECHTPAEHGQIVKSQAFSGGREFLMPDGSRFLSANITPSMEKGIGKWSEEAFITRFRTYNPATFNPPVLQPGEKQTIMPWTMYAGMDTADLKAMYRYLRTVKAK